MAAAVALQRLVAGVDAVFSGRDGECLAYAEVVAAFEAIGLGDEVTQPAVTPECGGDAFEGVLGLDGVGRLLVVVTGFVFCFFGTDATSNDLVVD